MNRKQRREQEKAKTVTPAPRSNPRVAEQLLAEAVRHHQAGRLSDAEQLYRQILATDARHADALHLLGMIAHQVGRNDIAVDLIGKAIGINRNAAAYHFNLGNALKDQGRLDDAVSAYGTAIRCEPDFAEAHSNLGIALQDKGRLDDAVQAHNTAIRLRPDYAEAHFNLGFVLHEQGRLDGAVNAYNAAIRCRPDFAGAHSNLGIALRDQGRLDDAIDAYNTAIRFRPDFADAHYNLGIALRDQGRFDEAVSAYNTAIRLQPDRAEAHINLGLALMDQRRLDDAIDACEAAIRVRPDFAAAHCHLGVVLQEKGRLDDAVKAYTTAIRLRPDYADAHSNLLMCMYYDPEIGNGMILERARVFATQVEKPPRPARSFVGRADPARRLRVGYVSGDFIHHPVGFFLKSVLTNHDRDKTEIFCYSNNHAVNDLTRQLRSASHHWRAVVGLSDAAAASLVAADGIDLLVDLSGHTARNRLPMFALKPAPVQITWLGYWGTTGLAAMDYILSDEVTIRPGEEQYYTEQVVRLPSGRFCYRPPDYAPQPADTPPMSRSGVVTFGSFNNLNKLGLDVLRLWGSVLHAVPGSRLLLKWKTLADERVRRELTDAFIGMGIGAARLELRGYSPHADMLAEYADIDIALDPFPFSGGLTSCEALWMGVPVVTLPGARSASRQTLGFLRSIGLAEWAAMSPANYVAIATTLANDVNRLTEVRRSLRHRMIAAPLCDGPGFTRELEAAYREMWCQWCQTG